MCVCDCVSYSGLSMLGPLSSAQIEITWVYLKHLWQTFASYPSHNPSTDSLLLTKSGILLHINHLLSLPGAEDAVLTFHKAPDFDIWWPR